jgi:hypothetical protein
MKQPDDETMRAVREAGRSAMRMIWEQRQERDLLDPAEVQLLDLLEAHPEYSAYWEGEEPGEDENPFLHVSFHQTVEKQLELGEPASVTEAFERLRAAGRSRHEAVHEIMAVLVKHVWGAMKQENGAGPEEYARALERLGRD